MFLRTVIVKCAAMIGTMGLAIMPTAANAAPADLRVAAAKVERDSAAATLSATTTIAWNNAWRNARNHDAVWLFAKVRVRAGTPWRHARIISVSPAADAKNISCHPASDHIGAFCAPNMPLRGDISAGVTLVLDQNAIPAADRASPSLEARVFGIEMVYVPAGPFSIGDPDPKSVEFAAYYRSNAAGGHAGAFRITSEASIRVAPEDGALYYRSEASQYQGDRVGPIPAEFPKGTRAFYSMKYEVLQGQYAAFLNTILRDATFFRAINAGIGYYDERGTIRLERGEYVAGRPDRPANWVSWDDGLAFADWAGLRPMTEFEFTKAARGPEEPGPAQFPWGTSSRERLVRRVGIDDDLIHTGPADEALLSDDTRDVFGASYYWVMDLAGSVWERVVTAGHPRGRAFLGTHGDGVLGNYGVATNADWPAGDHDGGGYGYRGGGFYERERERSQGDRDFNPYSPVEWRSYGSWGGAPRSVAYGFRAVRTADR